jgi:hypothetical protein
LSTAGNIKTDFNIALLTRNLMVSIRNRYMSRPKKKMNIVQGGTKFLPLTEKDQSL